MRKYKVVRTYPSSYLASGNTIEYLEKAFEEGWQFVSVTPIGERGVLEYIVSKEED